MRCCREGWECPGDRMMDHQPTETARREQSRMRAARGKRWGSCQGWGDTRRTGLRRPETQVRPAGRGWRRTVIVHWLLRAGAGKDKPCRRARWHGGRSLHTGRRSGCTQGPFPELSGLPSWSSSPLSALSLFLISLSFPSCLKETCLDRMLLQETWQGLMPRKCKGWSLRRKLTKRMRCNREVALKGQDSHALRDSLDHSQVLSDLRIWSLCTDWHIIGTKLIRG